MIQDPDRVDDSRPITEIVERGRQAAARGSWREAYDLLSSVEPAELSPGDLELIGEATSWTGPTERCIDASERAFNGYLSGADKPGAARIALRLARGYYLLSAGSVAAGWVKRAERLLEDEPECVEHGQLARLRGVAANARGDVDAAQEELRRALEIARRFGDRDLEALTLHNQGSVLIGAGEVEEGWALIDESAAAAAAGNLRPTATGSVYCWTITTCRDLQEVRRAGEWTARFERWCERTSLPGGWRGDCRVHHAEVLRLHGRWSEAEAEAEAACEDFLAFNMPGEAGQATYELGEIQLRRGDLGGAAASFRPAIEAGREPQPGLALLRLAEGKPGVGLSELTRALADVPDDRMERARLLPAFVELAVAAEQMETARDAAVELDALATLYGSDALTATACWARGLVALADAAPAAAVSPLRESVRRWHALDAPYEAARARTVLAEAYQATERGGIGRRRARRGARDLCAPRGRFRRAPRRGSPSTRSRRRRDGDLVQRHLGRRIGRGDRRQGLVDLVDWHDRTLRACSRAPRRRGRPRGRRLLCRVQWLGCGARVLPWAISAGTRRASAQHGFAPRFASPSIPPAIPAAGGFRGKGVHTAARVGAFAEANSILRKPGDGTGGTSDLHDPRTVELKGISEPVEIVSVDWT